MPEPVAVEQEFWRDLQPLLDAELSRLPDKYRSVVVLCDLEGKTRKEVARQLGCPEGTVAGRLARARALLARRLARHGLAVSGGALAAALTQDVASAGVPNSVVSSTIKAASLFAAGQAAAAGVISPTVAALTAGVMKAMLISKLKAVSAVVLIVGSLATGATVITCKAGGQSGQAAGKEKQPAVADKQEPDLGFYPPDKRLLGAQKTDKARAKSAAKLQAIAAIEANLKKLRENTDEELEREALGKIERAVLWYKDTKWLMEQLSVEKETVPFPTDKKQGGKNK
jgi:hypothetical protein